MKRSLLKLFVFGSIFIFLAVGLGVLGLHFYTDMKLYPRIVSSQNSVQQYEKWILADFKTLEKFPLFKNNEYKKDAGPFLQTQIPLTGLKDQKELNSQNTIVERLFQQYPEWLTNKVDFKGLTSDPQFAELDPKWMDQLKGFDHWAWSRQNETQERIQKARKQSGVERIGTLAALPVPNFALLRNWAAVYAIKKLQTKDLQAGLKIYRKVADLSNSTGTLVGQMQAVAMLKAEHKLMNDFQARDWQLLPLASIDAYKRLSWAWVHIVRQPFYSELKSEIKNYASATYGVCGGASENMMVLFGIREYLEPQTSFETSFAENYLRAEQFQESLLRKCHLDDFSNLVEFSSLAEHRWITDYKIFPLAAISMAEHSGIIADIFQRINWSRIPFVRKFIGLTLFATATPETLNMYREIANEKK